MRFLSAAVLGLLVLTALPAEAHRVNLFAWVEQNEVLVECGFTRSQKVKAGRITVFDAMTGTELLAGVTDATGRFRFPVPEEALRSAHDLRIQLVAGEGHQNEWTVSAAEFMPVSPAATAGTQTAAASEPRSASSAVHAEAPGWATPEDVERIVNASLEARLAPVKRLLAAQSTAGPTVRDIVGGIGWIFGLLGIAAYFRRSR